MLRGFLIALLFTPAIALADGPRLSYSDQLAAECDALIRDAIRRPYGWGWTRDAAAEPLEHPAPRVVSMDPLCTPAAGLVILWAGEQLHDPSYRVAAEQVARGISITQRSTGRVNSNVIFSRAPLVNDERAAVVDRSATRCALALLLALSEHPTTEPATAPSNASNESIHRSAARCTNWLFHQLTPNGFWPSAFPPDATPQKAMRIVRLDDNDYRDSSTALLLAMRIMPDDAISRLAANPTDSLKRIILKNDPHGPNLWNTAVTIDGTDVPKGFPHGPDVLASRLVMQTLMAGYLLTGERSDGMALDAACTTLRQCRRSDGLFDRFLDPTAAADISRQYGEGAATTQSTFGPPPTTAPSTQSVISAPFTTGTFGINPVIEATDRIKTLGRDRYIAMLSSRFTLNQQLMAMLCGLMDDPMTLSMPVSPDEIPAYLTANQERFAALDQPPPQDLPARVERIWLLLVRVKLEAMRAAK
ncbi:MAG: hypothetical protein JO353_00190 [Phycisphaerae bacterium]|nr:hypothetical protein [Phycisphaerae bacterium]